MQQHPHVIKMAENMATDINSDIMNAFHLPNTPANHSSRGLSTPESSAIKLERSLRPAKALVTEPFVVAFSRGPGLSSGMSATPSHPILRGRGGGWGIMAPLVWGPGLLPGGCLETLTGVLEAVRAWGVGLPEPGKVVPPPAVGGVEGSREGGGQPDLVGAFPPGNLDPHPLSWLDRWARFLPSGAVVTWKCKSRVAWVRAVQYRYI